MQGRSVVSGRLRSALVVRLELEVERTDALLRRDRESDAAKMLHDPSFATDYATEFDTRTAHADYEPVSLPVEIERDPNGVGVRDQHFYREDDPVLQILKPDRLRALLLIHLPSLLGRGATAPQEPPPKTTGDHNTGASDTHDRGGAHPVVYYGRAVGRNTARVEERRQALSYALADRRTLDP
jgi:hypothetical protein